MAKSGEYERNIDILVEEGAVVTLKSPTICANVV
jgi:hypothetical protein